MQLVTESSGYKPSGSVYFSNELKIYREIACFSWEAHIRVFWSSAHPLFITIRLPRFRPTSATTLNLSMAISLRLTFPISIAQENGKGDIEGDFQFENSIIEYNVSSHTLLIGM